MNISDPNKCLFHLTRAFDVIGAVKNQSICVTHNMFYKIQEQYTGDDNKDIEITEYWCGCQFIIKIDGYSILVTKVVL